MEKKTVHVPAEGNNGEIENGTSSSQNPETLEHPVLLSASQTVPNNLGIRKNYKRAANRGKKGSEGLTGQAYTLRSSDIDVRVLRSTSGSKTTSTEHVQPPGQPAAKRRKRSRASNKNSTDEFSQIRKRVRYILNRMNYEQSLIEAYASEGWKNQSLDKTRPEKELERAKSEILRCKLRIREVFQNIDSLLSKGKIDESLFDSEGEISCEDIFCATCGSKNATLGNDIILCDGACDRGFHQNCLNPPLRTEDIPMGDEGWLCPACDCKLDCIDLINELQGSDISIEDPWEKVDDLGLPSEDSEDDDYDPAGPDSDKDVEKKSNSDESDFTSDSDDFCKEIKKSGGHDEVSSPPLPDVKEAYGEASSDSSDEEEWSGKNTPIKSNEEGEVGSPAGKGSRVAHHNELTTQNTKESLHSLHGSVDEKHGDLTSNGSNIKDRKGHFGPVISQKLHEHFKTQPYPSRSLKESLAEELGLTFHQVNRWFENRRHFARLASSRKGISPDKHSPQNTNSPVTPSMQPKEPEGTVMEESNVYGP
ncbi:Putative homeodomain-like transcription factor superfamily protein [Zea mays]|uniref:Putative homeodomain-like transcription factor superfamily protein n=1 Tax=Zea mays TaxID=4577 RepID=A0A1D6MAU6_MAIZE|nr:Putative homeodomain-like transcription factor superfamily protein [Zea mays]